MTSHPKMRGLSTRTYDLSDAMRARMINPAFPKASQYDPDWVFDNEMGPNVLWLTEWATRDLNLKPSMKVLDLGCGKALSSIFLAEEFGVSVWATDLWIAAEDNAQRILAAGHEDRITAVHAEAHSLPYDEGFFDVIVSFDSYQYFGTADLYIGYLLQFLKPGGTLCILIPGVTDETGVTPPAHLQQWWAWDFCCFHTIEWWCQHWEKTGLVEIEIADMLPDGAAHWLSWCEICAEAGCGLEDGKAAAWEADMLREDAGRTFTFPRLIARKPAS